MRGLCHFLLSYFIQCNNNSVIFQDEVISICTMEKANMAVNMLLMEGRLHELTCVVVDEAHMVADQHR